MAEQSKILIIAKIDAAREGMLRSASQLREDLNMQKHVRSVYENHKGAWIGGAAALGWILARLPGRKAQQKLMAASRHNGAQHHPNGAQAKRYALSGVLLALLRMAFNAAKPALTAVASRKLKEMAIQRVRW